MQETPKQTKKAINKWSTLIETIREGQTRARLISPTHVRVLHQPTIPAAVHEPYLSSPPLRPINPPKKEDMANHEAASTPPPAKFTDATFTFNLIKANSRLEAAVGWDRVHTL